MKYYIYSAIFTTIELVGFFLPAFPKSRNVRLSILGIYFIGHAMHLQKKYRDFKKRALSAQ